MADKSSTVVIKVNLSCSSCSRKIKRALCVLQEQFDIQKIAFDVKNNTIEVSGPFDPDCFIKKISCLAGKVIKDIHVKKPPPPQPPTTPTPTPPPRPPPPPPPPQQIEVMVKFPEWPIWPPIWPPTLPACSNQPCPGGSHRCSCGSHRCSCGQGERPPHCSRPLCESECEKNDPPYVCSIM